MNLLNLSTLYVNTFHSKPQQNGRISMLKNDPSVRPYSRCVLFPYCVLISYCVIIPCCKIIPYCVILIDNPLPFVLIPYYVLLQRFLELKSSSGCKKIPTVIRVLTRQKLISPARRENFIGILSKIIKSLLHEGKIPTVLGRN